MTVLFRNQALRALALTGAALLNAACTVVGPDYVRPAIAVPPAYKEATGSTSAAAPPPPVAAAPGHWWNIYGDSQLDALMAQVETQNQSLQALEARLRQARALAEMARAAQSPTVLAGGTNDLGVIANWEIDLWGRIKRNIEASGAAAQASTADLAAATLSMQAQLAQNYFLLRVHDAGIRLLQDTAAAYGKSLQLARNQYAVGVASRGNVVQAQAQLGTAQAQTHNARIARAQLEHAIAVLIGKMPADFSVVATPRDMMVPKVPPTLPAALLERRPDIAAAERRMAAASAKIGVAEAAAYPSLDLFVGVSIRRGLLGGAKVAAPLYAGETPQARRSQAGAAYDEAVANYRQAVLNAMRDVEDNLVAQQALDEAAAAQDEAVKASRQSVSITRNQQREGIVNYLSVVVVQAAALDTERSALDLLGRRLVASVNLIKALGGGWEPAAPVATKTAE